MPTTGRTTRSGKEKPARRPRLGKEIYEKIREMAISYNFLPNESINEASLAKSLDVSRSPVRDALNRLVAEGLIVFRQNYGFFARSLSEDELLSLAEARLCLELEALRLAFERGSLKERRSLLEFWETADAAASQCEAQETARADEEFHMRIFKMSRNQTMIDMIEIVNARIRFVREIEIESPYREGADFAEHFVIANAMVDGDLDGALNAQRRHLTFTREHSKEILQQGILRIYQSRMASKT